VEEVTTTAAPTTTAGPSEIVMPNCELGEVARSDGTCQKITPEVIEEMKGLVRLKKHLLDLAEKDYPSTGKFGSCADCRLSEQIVVKGGDLLYAHIEYKRALDMLLAMMMLMTPDAAAAPAPTTAGDLGPEFSLGAFPGKEHCETWTGNETNRTTPEDCAVFCRHQPFCKSFAVDNLGHCVWFDYKIRTPGADECAAPGSLDNFHIKERNVTTKNPCGGKMQSVDITTQLLEGTLAAAESSALIANQSLEAWAAEQNETLKVQLEITFLDAKANYTARIADVDTVRAERRRAMDLAIECIREDSAELPALPVTTTPAPTTTTTTAPLPPVVELHWADFPNSQDSLWAEKHPECPQGPPCYCDCKCRGSPPQNFVEPPPPLPAPCPGPPPLPPANAFSMPLGAPALSPAMMR
jgi:hypothetical protein